MGTDTGTVKLYRVIGENEAANVHLEETIVWQDLHTFGYEYNFSPCIL